MALVSRSEKRDGMLATGNAPGFGDDRGFLFCAPENQFSRES
jgi:hypothetical protein